MELEEVNWRLQVVMVLRREVSDEQVAERRERCSGRLGGCCDCLKCQAPLYAPGKGGALSTADSGFPSDFITPGPVQLPTPDYSAQGRLTSLCCSEFPPSFGVVWG